MRVWVLVAVLLAGCATQKKAPVPIEPALVKLIPANSTALAGVRVDSLRKLPYYERLLTLGPSGGLAQLAADTGVDVRSGLTEVLLATSGKDTVAMMRGTFSPDAGRSGTLLVLDPSTAIAGPPSLLRQNGSGGLPRALTPLVESIDSSAQIWAVAVGGFFPGMQTGNWGNAGRLLERTRRFTVAATFGEDLVFNARGECASVEDATDMEGVARGMLGIARFTSRKTPTLQSFYQTISVVRQDQAVVVRARVPGLVLEGLLKEAGRFTPK